MVNITLLAGPFLISPRFSGGMLAADNTTWISGGRLMLENSVNDIIVYLWGEVNNLQRDGGIRELHSFQRKDNDGWEAVDGPWIGDNASEKVFEFKTIKKTFPASRSSPVFYVKKDWVGGMLSNRCIAPSLVFRSLVQHQMWQTLE